MIKTTIFDSLEHNPYLIVCELTKSGSPCAFKTKSGSLTASNVNNVLMQAQLYVILQFTCKKCVQSPFKICVLSTLLSICF